MLLYASSCRYRFRDPYHRAKQQAWSNTMESRGAASISLLRLICGEERRACMPQVLLLCVLASHGLDLSDTGRVVDTTL